MFDSENQFKYVIFVFRLPRESIFDILIKIMLTNNVNFDISLAR